MTVVFEELLGAVFFGAELFFFLSKSYTFMTANRFGGWLFLWCRICYLFSVDFHIFHGYNNSGFLIVGYTEDVTSDEIQKLIE